MTQWHPSASLDTLLARANLLRRLREFFYQSNILEVETPLLAKAGVSDPHVLNFRVFAHQQDVCLGYLQTSPEYAMKRLLAAGFPAIYQICKAFRDEERGRLHNPEFTLIEWYQLDCDHHRLMTQISAMLVDLLGRAPATTVAYADVFSDMLDIDVFSISDKMLQQTVNRYVDINTSSLDRDSCLQLLFSTQIEPHLGFDAPCFVYDYPLSQAALARPSQSDSRLAHRFELFIDGLELGNGFYELQDPVEQRSRFELDNDKRDHMGLPKMALDHRLLQALEQGLPDCAGVAIGFDRLFMLEQKSDHISKCLSFDYSRS